MSSGLWRVSERHLIAFNINAVFTRYSGANRKIAMNNYQSFVSWGLAILLLSTPAWSGEADVVDVSVRSPSAGVFHFDVTVRHADKGW